MRWPASLLLCVAAAHAAPDIDVQVVGQLANPRLTETSGIASSNRDNSVVWGVNDGGNAPLLHAFAVDGSDLGSVRIEQVRNFDWEDLASFVLNGTPYLLIADTGDNEANRRVSYLLIVEEPEPNANGRFGGDTTIAARLPFRYEDGPRDCEAVAVDVPSDRILLVSKRDIPAVVYELPLTLVRGIRRPLTARKIASLDMLPRPTLTEMLDAPLLGPWRYLPTALDIARDSSAVAMMTYQNLYLFNRTAGQDWAESFAATPRVLRLPALTQMESVAFIDGRLLAIAEGRSASILSIRP